MGRTPDMVKSILLAASLLALTGSAYAASAVNLDSEPRTITVTEGGSKQEIALGAGETVQFCANGCFVTMPNGDREALTGGETIEISGGVGRIK
jgi:opacity protein-like surface antigen